MLQKNFREEAFCQKQGGNFHFVFVYLLPCYVTLYAIHRQIVCAKNYGNGISLSFSQVFAHFTHLTNLLN